MGQQKRKNFIKKIVATLVATVVTNMLIKANCPKALHT